jgi:hypothetical protein
VTYLEELSRSLAARNVPSERILAEVEHHLRCDPSAAERLGDPHALAAQFAQESARSSSRRAAYTSFAALAPAGAGFATSWFLTHAAGGWPDIFSGEIVPLGIVAAVGMLLCPQVALAAGLLTLVRAGRGRDDPLLLRRARVALVFGAASLVSIALYAVEFRASFASWYTVSVGAAGSVLLVPLALAGLRVRRAAAIRADVPIAPETDLPLTPWQSCAVLALVVAAFALVAGGGDEGPRNAVLEAVAVLAAFLLLGRRLGIRRR